MVGDIFTIHKFVIDKCNINEPLYIIPFGDVHRYAPLCNVEKWCEFLMWAKKKKNCFFLGMGDYDDMFSTSERKNLQGMLHGSSQESINDIFLQRVNDFCYEISFMKGRIIGMLEGNHYGSMLSGITTTQQMCNLLSCKYLGVSSFVRVVVYYGNKSASIDMWIHHGKGAARLSGGSINTVQHMVDSADADIYLMGHDHKKSVALISRLSLTEGGGSLALHNNKILLGRTGSFLVAYKPNSSSYVAAKALSPTDLGVIKIELTPKRERSRALHKDNFYLDVHASI